MNRPKLLLIEDDDRTYRALRSLLRHDFAVLHSPDVEGGLALLEVRPSVCLLDLMLDDGDGLAILETIRARGLPIRVIVTTGIFPGPHLDAVLALAPDVVLHKPYHPEELDAALAPVLAARPS